MLQVVDRNDLNSWLFYPFWVGNSTGRGETEMRRCFLQSRLRDEHLQEVVHKLPIMERGTRGIILLN